MFKPTILIDFDGTITETRGLDSPPNLEVVAALNKLKDKYKIVIFSCRANRDIFGIGGRRVLMEEYLNAHNIPYDEICTRKPTFYVLIDDRAVNPNATSWDEIVANLLEAN